MSRVQDSWKRSDPNFTLRSPAGRKSEVNEYHSHFNSEKMQRNIIILKDVILYLPPADSMPIPHPPTDAPATIKKKKIGIGWHGNVWKTSFFIFLYFPVMQRYIASKYFDRIFYPL